MSFISSLTNTVTCVPLEHVGQVMSMRRKFKVDSVFRRKSRSMPSFLVGRLVPASPTSHRYVTSRGHAGMQFNDRGIQRTNGSDNWTCSCDQGFGYDPNKIAFCKIRTWLIIKNGHLGSENKQKKRVLAKWYLCASHVCKATECKEECRRHKQAKGSPYIT